MRIPDKLNQKPNALRKYSSSNVEFLQLEIDKSYKAPFTFSKNNKGYSANYLSKISIPDID